MRIAKPLRADLTRLDQLILAYHTYLRGQIRAGENKPDTFAYYEGELRRWAQTQPGDRRLEDLGPFDLVGAGGVAAHRIQAVKHLFKWAEDNGLIEANPFAKIKQPEFGRRERVLEPLEAAKLLRGADPRPRLHNVAKALEAGLCDQCTEASEDLMPVRFRSQASFKSEYDLEGRWCPACRQRLRGLWKAVYPKQLANARRHCAPTAVRPTRWALLGLGHTGLRPGELRRLQWSYYDDLAGHFALRDFKAKKRRRADKKMTHRIVLVSPLLRRILRIWKARRKPAPSDHIFLNWYGQPWSCNGLCQAVRRARKRAGLTDENEVVAYTFRHTVGTRAARPADPDVPGASLPEIAALLGQADLRSTQRYVHLPTGTKKTLHGALARPRLPKRATCGSG